MAKCFIGLILLIIAISVATYLFLSHPIITAAAKPTSAVPSDKTPSPATKTETAIITSDILIIRYPRVESANDERHSYHIQLLRIALEKTIDSHGPFALEPTVEVMNEIHMMRKLETGSDDIDVLFRPTSINDEQILTPIRIPLDKGLLGYRICLIRNEDADRLASIKSLADLQKAKIGQGRDWNDILVYQHNKIPVITGAIYEGLFEMLSKKRFDIFPRGIQEAYVELDDRKKTHPNLTVDSHLLIHYPFVRYMWVANSEKGKLLSQRLTLGLESIIADGTFDRLFTERYGQDIKRAQLDKRHLISIKNPGLPDNIPFDNKDIWFNPSQDITTEP